MTDCKYNPLGGVPKDGNFQLALSSKIMTACAARANALETNDLTVNQSLTVNGDVTATNLIATNNVTAGNDVMATGDITGTNLIATNNVTAGNDVIATGDVTATTVTVRPDPLYPAYDLPLIAGGRVNIRAYGADATGVADTSALLTTLMNSPVGGRSFYFPAGTYRFNTPIVLPQNVSIYGDHWGNTSFRYYDNTAGTRFITLNTNDSHVSDIYMFYMGTAVDSVLFYGNDLLQAQVSQIQTDTANGFGFFGVFDGTSRCLVTRSYISSTNTAIVCNSTANVTITENVIAGTVTAPAVETTGTARVQAFNNIISRTSTNSFVLAAAGSVIGNNRNLGTNKYTGAGVAGAIILSNDATEFSNLPNRLRIDGTAVLNAQQGAIPNDASGAVNQATVNAILTALRAHGLIAP